MPTRPVLIIAFLLSLSPLCAVEYGGSRADVLQEFGKPLSVLKKAGREVLLFRGNVRIELEEAKVVGIHGLTPDANGHFSAVPAAGPAPEAEAKPVVPVPTPEQKKAEAEAVAAAKADAAAEAKAAAEMERQYAAENAKAMAEMEKSIGQMERDHDAARQPPPRPSFNPLRLLLELGVKWVLMLAALALTCKYWGANVEWVGLMIAAAADTGVRGVIGAIGKLLGMFSLFYADEAVAAIVLLFVLRRVSTNKSLQQAVTITMTCKVFSVVVGSFLITVLLNVLY